jgi:histidinol-phosphate aminotransferase
MQTLSKAYGLAAARVGMAFANEAIVGYLNKVKPPYNVSLLNQNAALQSLENLEAFEIQKQKILESKIRMVDFLNSYSFVKKIYPSEANFLLVEVVNANQLYEYLVERKIIIRNRNNVVRNCIRISVGTETENQALREAMNDFENEMKLKVEPTR